MLQIQWIFSFLLLFCKGIPYQLQYVGHMGDKIIRGGYEVIINKSLNCQTNDFKCTKTVHAVP